ncbi:MAG: hypothetical protein EOO56_10440 [Hymenobacter sp.]|nr:MAG: hypothetical protein EOO56_10440 [Hymenobacter sp.]
MKRGLFVLVGWALVRPVWAEGGSMYPPSWVIGLGLLLFGLGIPAGLAGLAFGLARLLRPQPLRRFAPVFWAAWLTWAAAMLLLAAGYDWGVSEEYSFLTDGLLSFSAALGVALCLGRGRGETLGRGATPASENSSPLIKQ